MIKNKNTGTTLSKENTRDKILLTACELFAEKGFNGITHREIGKAADVNPALINYHFRSKQKLYEEVVEYCFQKSFETHPTNIKESISVEDKIVTYVRSRINSVLDNGPGGWFPRLIHNEMSNQNEISNYIRDNYIKVRKKEFTKLIAEYLNQPANELIVKTTVFNLSSQWILLNIARKHGKLFFNSQQPSADEIKKRVDHIIDFIIGGLRHVKNSCK